MQWRSNMPKASVYFDVSSFSLGKCLDCELATFRNSRETSNRSQIMASPSYEVVRCRWLSS